MVNQATLVAAAAHSKTEADKLYKNARKTVWFQKIIDELCRITGPGSRCMYCSGSEASDVEHYRPKAVFPHETFSWSNYLWSCTPCNRTKLNRFPPDTEPGAMCINPLTENVWDFFFIDGYGLLTPVWDVSAGALNDRAENTDRLLNLNREAVQETRKFRVADLKRQVNELLDQLTAGKKTKSQAKRLITIWRSQPFQPDVADYFFKGPGKNEAPFSDLFNVLANP